MQTKRIWEIDELFHCPLVGICLPIPQQRQILRRSGIDEKENGEYAVHAALIKNVREESSAAKRFEKQLNRKYQNEIAEWKAIAPEAWLPFFHRTLTPKTAGALLWFSAAYLTLDFHQRVEVYGEIHMLGFHLFWNLDALLRQIERGEKKHDALYQKYQGLRSHFRADGKILKEYERRHILQQKELEALRTENAVLQQDHQAANLQAERDTLQEKVFRLEKKLQTREIAAERLKAEKERFKQRLAEHRLIVDGMQQELAKILRQFASQVERCPNFALCDQRILIVGGMTRLRSFYEQLVTNMGGQFEYHDGYKYNGTEALSNLVERSDVVICPVDVNSHSACLHVKKCCKELNKPYYMLRNSSLSTIHKTLSEVARTPESRALA